MLIAIPSPPIYRFICISIEKRAPRAFFPMISGQWNSSNWTGSIQLCCNISPTNHIPSHFRPTTHWDLSRILAIYYPVIQEPILLLNVPEWVHISNATELITVIDNGSPLIILNYHPKTTKFHSIRPLPCYSSAASGIYANRYFIIDAPAIQLRMYIFNHILYEEENPVQWTLEWCTHSRHTRGAS